MDVRILSATNANVEEKIKKNEFREDLFYRLNTIPIQIPPLRERKEEILPLCEWVLSSTIKQYGLPQKQLSDEAKIALEEYRWYGNVRELISVVQRAVILSDEDEIKESDLFLNR